MIEITLKDSIDAETQTALNAVSRSLSEFNDAGAGQSAGYRHLAILATDRQTGETIGGLWAGTSFSHLHIHLLFVSESMRGTGLGRELMRRAEEEAIRRKCTGSWLDTFSFQARGFYERLGYTVFGTIEDYPPGHSRFFLKKSLLSSSSG
jgi:GNAT superfamily N-acetyltransferase